MQRLLPVLLLLVLGGCLPSSCARTDNYSLLPADSLSRQVAISVEPGTLEHIATVDLSDALSLPRTLAVHPAGGDMYVASPRHNVVVRVMHATGEIQSIAGEFRSPYLAGFRGDTLGVLSATGDALMMVADGREARTIPLEYEQGDGIRTAVLGDRLIYVKDVSESSGGVVLVFDDAGELVERIAMAGPHWRHSGSLRMWEGDVLSLSGYRPVVDVLRDGRVDTLALVGFDSPMLPRSRRFVEGGNFQPPLLSSSAAVVGDRLFAINMRPGWIQIDAYGRDGMLRDIWLEADPQPGRRFYPVDIDAVASGDGSIDLYVLVQQPSPQVVRYRIPAPAVERN